MPSGGSHVRVRRLSNNLMEPTDLIHHRNLILPPKHLIATSEAQKTAVEMEQARKHLDYNSSPQDGSPLAESTLTSPFIPSARPTTDEFALAFDIDGVLIRGGKPIPAAVEAMKYINGENPYGIRIPYIFVTNGGGKTEEERCLDLSKQLELEVSPGQFICGHTPMREMVQKFTTVLVVGGEGEKCRVVAEGYGFKDVVTPGDLIKTKPDITPFRKLTAEEHKNSRIRNFRELRIEAILVFADSRDWAGDKQIILDVLRSKNGNLLERSETFEEHLPVYFSHNDILWATSHPEPRLGMGAFRSCLEKVYEITTQKQLNPVAFGKPQIKTYEFATRLLQQWREDTHGINKPPSTVYFVGDTPESDILGTNEFNKRSDSNWFSILVETGVYQAGTIPRHPAKKTCKNVLEAVQFATERELGSKSIGPAE
ncbi:HAD-like domain-containing protein [Aspergillus carlsbadensis]|nr:HAD-like domain-containing protein [Aspergillus carlsbadensis]